MTVVVTGGTGFVGYHVIKSFVEAGHEAVIFDAVEPKWDLAGTFGDSVSFVEGDIRNRDDVRAAVKRSAGPVIHLAGIVSTACDRDPDAAMEINVNGTHNVLEAARQAGNGPVVVASTISVYGPGLPQPMDESMPAEPGSWYGFTKLMAEEMGLLYTRRYGTDFRAVRLAAVTGPGRVAKGSASLFTSRIPEKAALGEHYEIEVTEEAAYPVVYVKDAAGALLTLALAGEAPRRIYNIASGRVVARDLVAEATARAPGAQFSYKPDPDVMAIVEQFKEWHIDCTRAREDLGWTPGYSVERMVEEIMEVARRKR